MRGASALIRKNASRSFPSEIDFRLDRALSRVARQERLRPTGDGSGVAEADLDNSPSSFARRSLRLRVTKRSTTKPPPTFRSGLTCSVWAPPTVLSLDKLRGGSVVFSSQLERRRWRSSIASPCASRARFSTAKSGFRPDARVGEVTQQETQEGTERKPSRKDWLLGFGAAWLGTWNASDVGYSVGVARGWDLNSVRLKLLKDFDLKGSALLLQTALGARQVFLTRTDFPCPMSRRLGFRSLEARRWRPFRRGCGGRKGGFSFGASAGIELFHARHQH